MKTEVQFFFKRAEALVALFILSLYQAMAQSAAGIDQATVEVSSYVDPISNLIIAHRSRSWFDRRSPCIY